MRVDAVVTVHVDPFLSGGTGRFSLELARRLEVPCLEWGVNLACQAPLYSVRLSEVPFITNPPTHYSLFLHDYTDGFQLFIQGADRCLCANPEVAEQVRLYRPDAEVVWCPPVLDGRGTRGDIDVLTYGMAHHTFPTGAFEKLKALLDACPAYYTISMSIGLHHAYRIGQVAKERVGTMRDIFGSHLRVLGFLANDGLVDRMSRSTAIALFYPGGVRANNTTIWAALERGMVVVTNIDDHSPQELQHEVNCFDINQLTAWPDERDVYRIVRYGATKVAKQYGWEALLTQMQGVHA